MKGKANPWSEWIPGALSWRQVKCLADEGLIQDHIDSKKIDHSSFDLTLANECYELPSGSVKPFGEGYLHDIKKMKLATPYKPDAKGEYFLYKKKTYLFRLNERIPLFKGKNFYGQATAKSSIGRMDVLARLVVDGMHTYEEFSPNDIGTGEMYLEITPMTFNVKIKPGSSLSQLRLFKGPPSDCEIESEDLYNTVIVNDESKDGTLSLDTSTVPISGTPTSAFCSKEMDGDGNAIQLWDAKHTNPSIHWTLLPQDENERIPIKSSKFFIMRSFERIAVPKGIAVYCRAIDETIGEMRIHYAGFAHPYFGYAKTDDPKLPKPAGTPLVFEVRGHDVDVSLMHREKMARLVFYRMSEDANLEDKDIDDEDPYQHQDLQLSKFFEPWPTK